jgi:hypothetical protein
MQCRKLFVTTLYFAMITFAGSAIATDNFLKINLPKGVSMDMPKNWVAMSNNERITLDTAVESTLDLSGIKQLSSSLPFAANYVMRRKTLGMLNIRYYPEIKETQDFVAELSADDVVMIDDILEKEMYKSAELTGFSMVEWVGTKKRKLNGATVLVSEYRRKSMVGDYVFRVRLVRLLSGNRSCTITISYSEDASGILQPITDRILSSIKFD